MTPERLAQEVRGLYGERWAATGTLEGVLVVAVVGADDGDAARLRELAPGGGVLPVALSWVDLEQRMDAVETALQETREFEAFLQLSADGFTGTVRLVVDRPVPQVQHWASQSWGEGALQVELL